MQKHYFYLRIFIPLFALIMWSGTPAVAQLKLAGVGYKQIGSIKDDTAFKKLQLPALSGVSVTMHTEPGMVKKTKVFTENFSGINNANVTQYATASVFIIPSKNQPIPLKQFPSTFTNVKGFGSSYRDVSYLLNKQTEKEQASTGHLFFGGILGGSIGLVIGGAIGYMLTLEEGSDMSGMGLFLGAPIGSTIGIPIGVIAANRGQGNGGLTFLASIGGFVSGVAVAIFIDPYINITEGILVVPLIQITLCVWVEKKTTKK